MGSYSTPTHGRAAELHAAWHVRIFAVLSAHGGSIAVRLATIATVVWAVAADTVFATTTVVQNPCQICVIEKEEGGEGVVLYEPVVVTDTIITAESITLLEKMQSPRGRRDRVVDEAHDRSLRVNVGDGHSRGLSWVLVCRTENNGVTP